MIIVRLKGGVGNQLFQYALGGALQKHYGVPVSYDISKYKNDPLRKFELHALDLHAIGLADLGKPAGFVQRQVAGWTQRYVAARTDDLPEMERVKISTAIIGLWGA